MKRIIVDYSKLTNEILTLLVDRFPDGYDDSNIIRFRNAQNELIEAVEVKTEDTIYLVKVSTKLASRLENFDEDEDLDDVAVPIDALKELELEEEDEDEDLEEEDDKKSNRHEDSDDDEDDDDDNHEESDDDDEDDE